MALPALAVAVCAVAAGVVAVVIPPEAISAIAFLLLLGLAAAAPAARRARPLAIFGALVNAVAIGWTYADIVAPLYGYEGLVVRPASLVAIGAIALVAVAPALWLPLRLTRPSEVVLWFLYLFGYTPATLIPVFLLPADQGPLVPFELLILLGFLATGAMQHLLPRHWKGLPGLSQRSFDGVALALGLAAIAYLVVFFGLPTQIPDFVSAYTVRADFGSAQADVPASGYVVTWAGNVIFPLLIAIGLARRRPLWLALGVLGGFLLYTQGGAKAVLFNLLLTPALFVAISRWRDRFGLLLLSGSVVVLLGASFVTAVSGSLWPIALYTVRLIALPGLLTADYVDFFTSHQTYELSQSILRAIVPTPYTLDPPSLIGLVYFHTTVNANANLWADAVANFGLAGLVPFSIVLGLILWILDLATAGRDLRIVGAPLGLAGLSLANGAVLTSILTYGIGLLIVLSAAMPREEPQPAEEGTPVARDVAPDKRDGTPPATSARIPRERPAPGPAVGPT